MERITDVTYIKPNVTKQWLLSHNFRYNRNLSDEKLEIYTYRFPVYKYEKLTVLECEFCIAIVNIEEKLSINHDRNKVSINVYDYGTHDKYAPFYYCEYGNYDKMLEVIWGNIDKQLKRLGIKKHKNNFKNKQNK